MKKSIRVSLIVMQVASRFCFQVEIRDFFIHEELKLLSYLKRCPLFKKKGRKVRNKQKEMNHLLVVEVANMKVKQKETRLGWKLEERESWKWAKKL